MCQIIKHLSKTGRMVNLKAELALKHEITIEEITSHIGVGGTVSLDHFIAQHTRGSSGQQGYNALFGHAALFGDARASEFLHVLAVFAFAAVVTCTRLTFVTADAATTLHVRSRDMLWA